MQRVTQKSLDRQRTIGGELWDDDYSLDLVGIIILPERAMSFPFPWLMTPLIASDSLYMAMVRQTVREQLWREARKLGTVGGGIF